MPQRTPDGPPPAAAVQKLRIRYARRGRMRFSSTRDFARALERALRRAGVPMAYSAGFHPHPRISYANGAPTGMASEAEYFEISLTHECDPDALGRALDDALPDGLDVLAVVPAPPGHTLGELLVASEWRLEFPDAGLRSAQDALAVLLDRPEALVSRVFKTGPREFDVRSAIVRAAVVEEEGCAIMHLVVRHTTPAVRPDDILTALRDWAQFSPPAPAKVTRMAQGPWNPAGTGVADPLAPRDGAAES